MLHVSLWVTEISLLSNLRLSLGIGVLLPSPPAVTSLSRGHLDHFHVQERPNFLITCQYLGCHDSLKAPSCPWGHSCLPRMAETPGTWKKSQRKQSRAKQTQALAFCGLSQWWRDNWAFNLQHSRSFYSAWSPPHRGTFGKLVKPENLRPHPTSAESFL